MSNIKIFEKEEFGKIRAKEIDGEVWFSGRDVSDCLQYENSRKAIKDHVDESDKITVQLSDLQDGNETLPSHMGG
jgi:prophage antirepressor-like protein